ncbi:hypothetical protein BDF22DRAFT_661922 [Syncephalis plumigaleata]|nr:hypothetical protein BDF22DRAFT_661922 [Syncephalis plumigaleata]
MPRGKANRLHHSRLITYLLQRLITVAIFIVGLGVIWLVRHLNELRGHLERQSHTLDAMLARTTTRDQECQSAAPSGLPSLPFDTIEYSDMPIITTTTTTESILADVACATLSSIDNDHPYAMCAEDNHNQPRHYAIPLYKEEEASNNDYSNQLNTISAKLSATSIYDYHQQHYHHDGDDNDLIEDLSLLLDTPISPELASLCSSPSTSVPTSPDFNGETESIALDEQQTITTITTNTTNTTTMSDTNNYNITIETVAYKPVLPVATAVVPLPQPTESTSTATATAEKTWSIAKGRFVPISKVHDDDNADCQNNNSQQDTMTWHDVPSLSTFWISDTLVTPDDTEMASEYLWEEPSSFYSEN